MNSLLCTLLLGAAAQLSGAAVVADLPVSESVAAYYGCGAECYKRFSADLAKEVYYYGNGFDGEFYATASNFSVSASTPGDLLKMEPINATILSVVPGGSTSYRFQYVSADIAGEPVPATGFIVVPDASRNNGRPYPLMAFAHGTSGVFRRCAPSAMASLYDYNTWSILAERGYAVVAPDYVGLGNNHTGLHQYLASPVQANDLFYSVVAARQAFDVFTNEWMGIGHSQGGGAAWALAESPLVQDGCNNKAGRYIGTVALAPSVRVKDMARIGIKSTAGNPDSPIASADGLLGIIGLVVLGLRSIAPGLEQNWLRPVFKRRLELAHLSQACFDSAMSLVTGLDVDEVLDRTDLAMWEALDIMQNLTARGDAPSRQPVLVLQGLEDFLVLPEPVQASYSAGCRLGNEIHMRLYPGEDHGSVIQEATPFFLQWIDDRFEGKATSGVCSSMTDVLRNKNAPLA